MQLPPVEQRVAKHDAVFADLHTPYKEYRGIHYAKKGSSTLRRAYETNSSNLCGWRRCSYE